MRFGLFLLAFLLFGFESFSQQHQISGGMGIGSLTFDRFHDWSFSRKNVR